MVSSDEIRRRLEAKRRGVKLPEEEKTSQATVECSECQTPNPATAKFCVGCGAPLAKKETPRPQTVESTEEPVVTPAGKVEAQESADYKLCPSCNQKNKLDAKFCIICGHKFEDAAGSEKVSVEVPESEPSAEAPIPPTPEVEPIEQVEEVPEKEPEESPAIPEIKVPEHLKSDKVESEEEPVPEVTTEDADPAEKIKKAKELLDIGAITQEEFDKIKDKYLEQM